MAFQSDKISVSEDKTKITLSYSGYFESNYEGTAITFLKSFYEKQIHRLIPSTRCTIKGREGNIELKRIKDLIDIVLKTPTKSFQTQCDYQDLLTPNLRNLFKTPSLS